MNTQPGAVLDRPLRGSAKLALFAAAGATILLSYLFFAVAFLLLLVSVGFEILLLLVLLRFGLAGLFAWVVEAHVRVLTVFGRSFWLRKPIEFRIQLLPADAPALFEMVQNLCQKAQVEKPRQVTLEMSVNAWVRLKGYRRGAGKTILGVGYDLLAGLSQWEMEGVLAHEITHAKLVQRGYKNWLNRGLGRMGQLARSLYALVEGYRKAKKSIPAAPFLFAVTDKLTRLAARLVAGCSRQDEFEADRGAAALCGAAPVRSSLLKLEPLAQRAARLPWNERVARLQTGEGFSQWLVSEFTSAPLQPTDELKSNLFFKYSTHPSLADRLGALPSDAGTGPPGSPPAIWLLNDPDHVAETLIAEIQKIAAQQERKDSKRLRRFTKKTGRTHLGSLQTVGVLLFLSALVSIIALLATGMSFPIACLILGPIFFGVLCFRLGRYRDRLSLPVPDFAVLKAALQQKLNFSQQDVKTMETELQASVAKTSARRKKELELAVACYDSLGRCDYVRAHVAARLCLRVNKKSIEGTVGLAVAAAALGQVQQVHQALIYLQRTTGMRTPSLSWGAGWALSLCRDWAPAEAFLEIRCQGKSPNPTVLLLLAVCQSNRGKLQSALLSARQACSPEPANNEHAKFMIDLLLQAGYLREAQERLSCLNIHHNDDLDILLQMVRLNLLLQNFTAAGQWTERLKSRQPGAPFFVTLGKFHEVARKDSQAAAFYQEALAAGFYPEALLGLARLETRARHKEEARTHLLSALNTQRELGQKALGPLPLFPQILGQLLLLEDPIPGCQAWLATVRPGRSPPGVENKQILIYAPSREQAETSLLGLLNAMQPAIPPIPGSSLTWSEARKEQQPDGPVRPGIQGLLN